MKTKKEIIKDKISKQILMGGGEALVDAIYDIFCNELAQQRQEMVDKVREISVPEHWDDWSIEKQLGYNLALQKILNSN